MQKSKCKPNGRQADLPYRKYNVGTTNIFNNVDVVRPQRITMAIGVWISLPDSPAASASGMSASPAASNNAEIRP